MGPREKRTNTKYVHTATLAHKTSEVTKNDKNEPFALETLHRENVKPHRAEALQARNPDKSQKTLNPLQKFQMLSNTLKNLPLNPCFLRPGYRDGQGIFGVLLHDLLKPNVTSGQRVLGA